MDKARQRTPRIVALLAFVVGTTIAVVVLLLLRDQEPLVPNYPQADLAMVNAAGEVLARCSMFQPAPSAQVAVQQNDRYVKRVELRGEGHQFLVRWEYVGRDGTTDRYRWDIRFDNDAPIRPVSSYNGNSQAGTVYSQHSYRLMIMRDEQTTARPLD